MTNSIDSENSIVDSSKSNSKNNSHDANERNSDRKFFIFGLISGGLVLIASLLAFWTFALRTVPRLSGYTIELGEEVPAECGFYMTGASFRFNGAEPDISKVNNLKEGDYPVYLTLKNKDYIFDVSVVDTVAPKLILNSANTDNYKDAESTDPDVNYLKYGERPRFTLELGQAYTIDYFFSEITESSGNYCVDMYVNNNFTTQVASKDGTVKGNFCFDYTGSYVVTFESYDLAGNKSFYGADFIVEDTTAPEISLEKLLPCYKTGQMYVPSDFADIYDASKTEETHFSIDGQISDELFFDDKGNYDITIVSTDASGNETQESFAVSFDDAPVFIAVDDKCILTGSDYDPSSHVAAVDSTDGNITDSIIVDKGGFDSGVPGTYVFTYSVTDSCGLTTFATENIIVGDVEDTSYELTDEEFAILNEYAYFSYEPLEEPNLDSALAIVTPSLVNLKYNFAGGYIAGSGFIYRIDEDYIYIVSCNHVIKDMNGPVEIMFDDSSAYVAEEYVTDSIVMGNDMECAMFRIPSEDIPYEVILEIKEVNVNPDIYSRLTLSEELFAYSGHFINGSGRYCTVYLRDIDVSFASDAEHCVETSHAVVHGMSGCPLFDEYGQLVGVTDGYLGVYNYSVGNYEYKDYFLMIDGLETMYENWGD